MLTVTEMGAICCPPRPPSTSTRSVQDVVDASVACVLDLIDVPHTLATRWAGLPAPLATAS